MLYKGRLARIGCCALLGLQLALNGIATIADPGPGANMLFGIAGTDFHVAVWIARLIGGAEVLLAAWISLSLGRTAVPAVIAALHAAAGIAMVFYLMHLDPASATCECHGSLMAPIFGADLRWHIVFYAAELALSLLLLTILRGYPRRAHEFTANGVRTDRRR